MLKKFEVKNFKNFKEKVTIDFDNVGGYQFSTDCITDDIISKMLIYGRNATGKSNLGHAIMNINANLGFSRITKDKEILNADSDDSKAEFKYTFLFDGKEVIYKYNKFSNLELLEEELIIDGERSFYVNFLDKYCDFNNLYYLSPELVTNSYVDTVFFNRKTDGIMEYPIPLLRWLISNTTLTLDSALMKLSDYVRRMYMVTVGSMAIYGPKSLYETFYENLIDEKELREFEEFLNFMGVVCRLHCEKLSDGQYELYFKQKKLLPFHENASSGTLALMNLYIQINIGKTASFLYLDEFDAFYHFEMTENLIRYFKLKFPNCQIILTSHNTKLMSNRLFRPDCLFILSRNGKLTSLNNATKRELREGHNLEKMYISGEFDAYE